MKLFIKTEIKSVIYQKKGKKTKISGVIDEQTS